LLQRRGFSGLAHFAAGISNFNRDSFIWALVPGRDYKAVGILTIVGKT
jgi:hypothetical protein